MVYTYYNCVPYNIWTDCTKNIACLSEIETSLGGPYFSWQPCLRDQSPLFQCPLFSSTEQEEDMDGKALKSEPNSCSLMASSSYCRCVPFPCVCGTWFQDWNLSSGRAIHIPSVVFLPRTSSTEQPLLFIRSGKGGLGLQLMGWGGGHSFGACGWLVLDWCTVPHSLSTASPLSPTACRHHLQKRSPLSRRIRKPQRKSQGAFPDVHAVDFNSLWGKNPLKHVDLHSLCKFCSSHVFSQMME